MAKKITRVPLCFFALLQCALLLCTGCTVSTNGIFGILTGVLSWSQQNWALASSSFLEVAENTQFIEDSTIHDYAVYGLASTYLAQDEYDSSLARLAELEKSSSAEIRSSVAYQAGIIAFRRGEFDEASLFFRKSLENDPSKLDAKINLELSHLSLVERRADRSASSSGIREESTPGQEAETIFNLVRKKEQDRWKNQEDTDSRSSVADY